MDDASRTIFDASRYDDGPYDYQCHRTSGNVVLEDMTPMDAVVRATVQISEWVGTARGNAWKTCVSRDRSRDAPFGG